jgi:Glycosyl hydrolases family 2, TIM barrel domain
MTCSSLRLILCSSLGWTPLVLASPVAVTIEPSQGLMREGKPYFVKGAGGETQLAQLATHGANSVRTWSTNKLAATLDEAARLGLTVSAGIWLESECSWFSYSNPEHRAKQAERVKQEILAHCEHPALLAWGLGNECEGDGQSAAYWQQLEALAVLAKQLDPAHPTFTAVAGLSEAKADGLNQYTPHLDYVGINTYGALFSLRKHLEKIGWHRPWMLTEWGPQGFWERPKSASGAPLEQTSTEKAEMMSRGYDDVISKGGACLGSYAFVWGHKFEATATWFGLQTQDGDTTASVDVLEQHWTNHKPLNTAPSIQPLKGVPTEAIAPGSTFKAHTIAIDAEGDPLKWRWAVLPEKPLHSKNGRPATPPAVPGTVPVEATGQATITAPAKPGDYRLYLWVTDGQGHAATANAPFVVK